MSGVCECSKDAAYGETQVTLISVAGEVNGNLANQALSQILKMNDGILECSSQGECVKANRGGRWRDRLEQEVNDGKVIPMRDCAPTPSRKEERRG